MLCFEPSYNAQQQRCINFCSPICLETTSDVVQDMIADCLAARLIGIKEGCDWC